MITSIINGCVEGNLLLPKLTNSTEPNAFENEPMINVKSKTKEILRMTLDKQEVKELEESSKNNSISFENISPRIQSIDGDALLKVKGTRLLANRKQTEKVDKDLKSELTINEAVGKEQNAKTITGKVITFFLSPQSVINKPVHTCLTLTNYTGYSGFFIYC